MSGKNNLKLEKDTNEYKIQNAQYAFPYHHLAHMGDWHGHVFPSMDTYYWSGFEYLAYNQHIIEKIMSLEPKSLLDVGCGDGKFLQLLRDKVSFAGKNMKMDGIDISQEAINLACCLNLGGGVSYQMLDISGVTDKYDCITCIEVLEHIPDDIVPCVIAHIHRCLKPGGVAIICVPSTNIPKLDKHFRHYDVGILDQEIAESGVEFKRLNVEYFWKKDALKRYLFWTANCFMYIRFRLMDSILWKKSFKASSKDGAHLIVELKKSTV